MNYQLLVSKVHFNTGLKQMASASGFQVFQLQMCPLFCKADRLCGPASTWTVQDSLDNADAGKPLAQDCPAPFG